MNKFNEIDLSKAFDAGVYVIALECNRRIQEIDKANKLQKKLSWMNGVSNLYQQGRRDALSELLEWMEFSMDKKG